MKYKMTIEILTSTLNKLRVVLEKAKQGWRPPNLSGGITQRRLVATYTCNVRELEDAIKLLKEVEA